MITILIIAQVVLIVLVCWVAYKSGNDKAFILTEVERQMNHFVDYKEETDKLFNATEESFRNVWVTEREITECLNNTAQALIEYVQMNNATQKDLTKTISLLAAGKEKTVH
jgi:uncharacterized membrane-anchored protein YhcB (DUF1043 family)